jgi:hypothetical protein
VLTGDRAAFADGPGVVRVTDSRGVREKWKFDAGDAPSLTGEPPQVRAWGDAVFVAVRRNHGVEIDRLRPFSGTREWDEPAFLDADRIDLAACDADPWRVFVPCDGKLHALTLAKGEPSWEADLPETNGAGGWVVRAGRRAVIAYPASAVPAEPPADVAERFVRSLPRQPLGWRLPAVAAGLYDAWVARSVPVLLFDPEDGTLLKQLDVPARGPGVTAYFAGDTAVVVTGGRVAWIK